MKLEYAGRDEIPASKDVVWAFINDPASIASCMPDVLDDVMDRNANARSAAD